MPLNSVNTNTGAMIALQSLNSTTSELSITQSRINTGRKINDAKDNAAIWAIAQGQRGEVASYGAVKDSLQRGQSAIDVALSAGEAVSDNLIKMKSLALAASDINLDQASRDALQEEYRSSAASIRKFVQNASFNGINLLDGSTNTGYSALANSKGTTTVDVAKETIDFRTTAGSPVKITGNAAAATVVAASTFSVTLDGGAAKVINVAAGDNGAAIAKKVNDTFGKNVASLDNSGFLVFSSSKYTTGSNVVLTAGSGDYATNLNTLVGAAPVTTALVAAVGGAGKLQVTGNETFTTGTAYAALLGQLDESLAEVNKSIGRLGSGSKTMEAQLNFVSKLSDTLEAGIGNLVDADLAKESARLQALQTKQQLGVQALSIANQSTGVLLGLFR